MKLFWTQNENPNISDTLIDTNGIIIELEADDNDGSVLFNELLDYQETSKPVYKSGNVSIKKHLSGGYFISSNFSNKDDIGRPMAFMFFTQNKSKEKIISDLLFFCNLIQRSITNQDRVNIDKALSKDTNINNKQIVKFIAVAIAVLIIYMLWKKIS